MGPVSRTTGPPVGIQNTYPNYDDDDIFLLPNLNNCQLQDLESSRIDPSRIPIIGQYITEFGNDATPLSLITSFIDVNFAVTGVDDLAGKITGIELNLHHF